MPIITIAREIYAEHDPILDAIAILIACCLIALAYLAGSALWYATRSLRERLADRMQPVPDDSAVAFLRRTANEPPPRGGKIASAVIIDRSQPRMDRTMVDVEPRYRDARRANAAAARPSDICQRTGCADYRAYHSENGCRGCDCAGFLAVAVADPRRTDWATEHQQEIRLALPSKPVANLEAPQVTPVVREAPPTRPLQRPMLAVPPTSWLMPKPAPVRVVDERDELVTLDIPAPEIRATAPEPEPETREHGGILRRLHLVREPGHEGATLTSPTPMQELAAVEPDLPAWELYGTAEHEQMIGQTLARRIDPAIKHLASAVDDIIRELTFDQPLLAARIKPSSYEWTGEMNMRAELDAMLATNETTGVAA